LFVSKRLSFFDGAKIGVLYIPTKFYCNFL
jgi:hypothetical protein